MKKTVKQKNIKRKKKVGGTLIFRVCLAAMVCYFSYALVMQRVQINASQAQLAQIEAKCEVQRLANKEVQGLLAMDKDTNYLEKIAREKLGYAYPDEQFYVDISGD